MTVRLSKSKKGITGTRDDRAQCEMHTKGKIDREGSNICRKSDGSCGDCVLHVTNHKERFS